MNTSEAAVPLYQSGTAMVPIASRLELTFETTTEAPLLVIPPHLQHGGSGKYNYSVAQNKPFSFEDVTQVIPEVNDFAVQVEPDDFIKEITEPEVGAFHKDFDGKKFEKGLSSLTLNVPAYVPYIFKNNLEPMRPPDQIEDKERLVDIESIVSKNSRSRGDRITFIKLADSSLGKHLKSLGKTISAYTNLNVLILRSVGLKKVDDFNLPKLQYCDFAGNQIPTAKTLLKMWTKAPFLEVVKVKGNPVAAKATFRPKIIANCSIFLKAIDDELVTIEDRVAAMAEYGPKQIKGNLGNIHWDLCFSACQEVKGMSEWNASKIVLLSLPKLGLETFNVGCLVNLEFLDLSKNKIKDLHGAGLERCKSLKRLNLRNNEIQASANNYKVFSWMMALQYLVLKGNPIASDPSYKQQIVFHTKFLKGNNRVCGLVELDEVPITIDERVDALKKITKHNINVDEYRWFCVSIQYYGWLQTRTEDVCKRIQNCVLPKNKLRYVNLSPFPSLRYLDLSKNNLRDVNGLDTLKNLRYLNLSDNPNLKWQHVATKQLANLKTLEAASFQVTEVKDHQCNPENKKYRGTLLKLLLDKNHNLAVLDEVLITPAERVEAYKMMKGVKNAQVEAYRFQLAVTINAVDAKAMKYHPSEVAIGAQYKPAKVRSLLRLHSIGLVSSAVDFKKFSHLEEINLAKNKLTDLTCMGLQDLKKLRVLDVSDNSISGSIKNLAAFVDTLLALECLGIRGNPVMKNWVEDRRKLIGSLKCVKNVNCTLRVIDTEISIAERVECWKKYAPTSKTLRGLKKSNSSSLMEDPFNKFRMDVIRFLRFPPDIAPNEFSALDLHDCSLETFDVRPYKNLEVLLLGKNNLKGLESLPGFFDLGRLQVCDLRDNLFTKVEDFISIVQKLPCLVSLGISGNKATSTKDYRAKFLKQIPELHEKKFALNVLDNDPISIDEICDAWKESKKMTASAKFMHVLVLRKIRSNQPVDKVVELDLSYCNIATIDLSQFVNVRKLSLKGNRIETAGLEGSQVAALQGLQEFDVSNNKIQSLELLAGVCTKLKHIVSYHCDGNPAFLTNNEDIRVQFLAKLPQMRTLGASLKLLNGFEIGIAERCIAIEKKMEAEELEGFRMDLLFEKLQLNITDIRSVSAVNALKLDHFGLTTLIRLAPFGMLRYLDVSYNNLTQLEQNVLYAMPWLMHLDIRENMLQEKGAKILQVLCQCRSLRVLLMKNSTADKTKTAKPKAYLQKICSVLRQLEYLDNLPNPFHLPQQSLLQGAPIPMPAEPQMFMGGITAQPFPGQPFPPQGFGFPSPPLSGGPAPFSPQPFPHGSFLPQGLQPPQSPHGFYGMTTFSSAPDLGGFLGSSESSPTSPQAPMGVMPVGPELQQRLVGGTPAPSSAPPELYKEASVEWGDTPAPSKVHEFADSHAGTWKPAQKTAVLLPDSDEDSTDEGEDDAESDYDSEEEQGGDIVAKPEQENEKEKASESEDDGEKEKEDSKESENEGEKEKEEEGGKKKIAGDESEFRKNKRFGKLIEAIEDSDDEEEEKAREEEKTRMEKEEQERQEREEREREEREREEEEREREEREHEEREEKERAEKEKQKKAKGKEKKNDSSDESESMEKKGDETPDEDSDSDSDTGKEEGGEDYWEASDSESEPAEFGGSSSLKSMSRSFNELVVAATTIDKDNLLAPVDYG